MSNKSLGSEELICADEKFAIIDKKPLFQLKNYYWNCVFNLRRYLQGRIFTIVDASISDLEQRKALKDIIREAIHSEEYHSKEFINVLEAFDEVAKLNTFETSEVRNEFFGGGKCFPSSLQNYFKK